MELYLLIERYLPVVTAVATMVTAVATAVMVWATHRIAKVNERMLKSGRTPQVVAYLEAHFNDFVVPILSVVLENIGQGPAQNVTYKLDIEDEYGRENAERIFIANKTYQKIDFLPQGARREITLGSNRDLYDEDSDLAKIEPFKVTVNYENLEGKKYAAKSFTLDANDFIGTGGMATLPIVEIAQSIKKIEKRLNGLRAFRIPQHARR